MPLVGTFRISQATQQFPRSTIAASEAILALFSLAIFAAVDAYRTRPLLRFRVRLPKRSEPQNETRTSAQVARPNNARIVSSIIESTPFCWDLPHERAAVERA
jgi:hypothetical protein